MGKIQLNIPASEKAKFEVAAHFSGININEAVAVGNEIVIEATYRTGNQLLDCGRRMTQVKGDELDALKKARAEKAKEAEKAKK